MDLFLVIYVILGIGQCLSAPTSNINNNTFFTAINSSCYNSADLLLTQKEIFEHCQNFSEISQTKSLSTKTEKNFLCLLYYKSITSCCKSHNQTVKYPTSVELRANNKYEIGAVCDNIVKYSKNVFPNNSIQMAQCLYLCTEIDASFNASIKPECLFAHYYYIQNQLPVDSPQPNGTNVGNKRVSASAPNLTSGAAEEEISGKGAGILDQGKVIPGQQGANNTSHLSETNANPLNHASAAAANGNIVTDSNTVDTKAISLNDGKNQQVPVGGPQESNAPQSDREDITDNGPQNPNAPEPAREGSIDQPAEESAKDKPKPNNDQRAQPEQAHVSQQHQQSNGSPGKDGEPQATKKAKTDDSKPPTKADPKLESSSTNVEEPKQEPMDTDVDGQHGSPNLNEDVGDYPDVPDNVAEGQEVPSKQQAAQEDAAEHKLFEKKPDIVQENPISSESLDDVDGESYFFSYFMVICVLFVLGYVGYHNRIKVMALLLEGKRNKRQQRARRPNSANYHKLDSNLEEAISSNVTKNTNNVIY